MASASEAVRRLSIKAETVGVDTATAQLNKLADAQSGVAVASASTEKATLSLDRQFANIERRYVSNVRAQQDYDKVQRQVNAAVSQNPALQDRANTILAAAKERHDQLTNSQKALSVVSQDLNSRIQASAGSFGVVGQAISVLGPVGVATAATMGSLAVAFYAASAGAHELAQKSRELKDFSESTGLTTAQVQALRSEAVKFGVDSDTLQSGLQKFTTGFQELRLGSGDLLTQIRRVNPALADQMAAATDTATAFTLYTKAVAGATNVFERNALARAGMGKGGLTMGEFLGSVGDVNALGASAESAGKILQKDVINKLADLDLQIAKTTKKARENFSSIFANEVLQSELAFANGLLKISEYAKGFKFSDDMNKFIGFVTNPATLGVLAVLAGGAAIAAGPLTLGGGALAVGAGLLGAGAATGAVGRVGSAASPAGVAPTRIQIPTDNLGAPGPAARTPQFDVATERLRITLLGDAATASEKLALKTEELKLGQDGYKLSTERVNGRLSDYERAVASLRLDTAISQQSAYVSALGEFATTQDKATLASQNFQKSMMQNPRLTDAQRVSVVNLVVANDEWARAANRAQIGVFDLSTATKAATDQFEAQKAKGGLLDGATPEQLATAWQSFTNKIVALGEAAAVAGSKTPQLTQLALDAGNLNKQLDTTITGSLNNFSDALVSIGNGSATAGQAFQNFGLQVVSALQKMIIQMTIIQPLAQSFQGVFGGGGGVLGFLGLGGGPVGNYGQTANVTNLGAGTGGHAFPMFANGTDSAPGGWSIVGERGPELMNVQKGAQIISNDNLSRMASGGSSGKVEINVINNGGGQVEQRRSKRGDVDVVDIVVGAVKQDMAAGGFDGALGGRYGASPRVARR